MTSNQHAKSEKFSEAEKRQYKLRKEDYFLNAKLMNRAFDNYNKFLLTLSSGAITLSLTFIANFSNKQFNTKEVLYISWGCWIVTIIFNLFSFFFSAISHEKVIKQINEGTRDTDTHGGIWSKIARFLDIGAGFTFLAAIVLLCIFGCLNIK